MLKLKLQKYKRISEIEIRIVTEKKCDYFL